MSSVIVADRSIVVYVIAAAEPCYEHGVILAGLAIAMALLVTALLLATRARKKNLEWVIKPLAALTFVAAGPLLGALETTWGTVLFAGLVLAAIGDVLLIAKRTFLAGLVAFLLGHVAYAIAFAVRGVSWTWTGATAIVLALVALVILRWLWPHVEGKMRIPVAAYVVVITSMVALGLGTFQAHGGLLILIGAIGFYLSDLSVARDKFVAPGFVNRLWGLPLYFGAQLLLAASAWEHAP